MKEFNRKRGARKQAKDLSLGGSFDPVFASVVKTFFAEILWQ